MSSSDLKNQSKKPNSRYCTNTYEQQKLIDERLSHLMQFLQLSEKLRSQCDESRSKLKENLGESFDQIKLNLNRLEAKTLNKIDVDLLQKQVDAPIRSLESQINQLIGNLNSLSMLNDSEKLLILKNIDMSIKQIQNKLESIEEFNKGELGQLIAGNKYDLNNLLKNKLDRIEKFLMKENLNLNTLVLHESEMGANEPDYRKWLLKTDDNQNKKINLNQFIDYEDLDHEFNAKRRNSFDFVDMNSELESIDVMTDFDDGNYKNWLVKPEEKSSNRSTLNTYDVSHMFKHIYEKPMEYWLLKSSNNNESNNSMKTD